MWYQLTAPPTVETHPENLIRLFVRDENGLSVANAHVKVWAGPPPDGAPPSFTDDFPFRMTNASGMLEYFVLVGPMPEDRDYWMQLVGKDGTLQSDPIQFHFPKGSTIWTMGTIQASETGGPEIKVPTLQWDPRLSAMNITVAPVTGIAPGQPYWKVVAAEYQDETQAGGTHSLHYRVVDQSGKPMPGVPIQLDFQGRAPYDIPPQAYTDGDGMASNGLYSGTAPWNPRLGPGPYSAWVGDPDVRGRNRTGIPSDKIVGVGLPMNRYVSFLVTWAKVISDENTAFSSIVGTIANAAPGVHVTLASEAETQTTMVDRDGKYAFNHLAAGAYSVSVTGGGVIASNIVLDGTENSTTRVDYTFRTAPGHREDNSGRVAQGASPRQPAPSAPAKRASADAHVVQSGPSSNGRNGNGNGNGKGAFDASRTVGAQAFAFEPAAAPAADKPLVHYLLFGSPEQLATRTNLILALDYIGRFAPTVGFSVAEAKGAANVTIVGANAIGGADEQALIAVGCAVRHIAGSDAYAIDQLFAQLLASGNPYPGT